VSLVISVAIFYKHRNSRILGGAKPAIGNSDKQKAGFFLKPDETGYARLPI